MTTGRSDYLELGDWNATCYECGHKFKASTMMKNWQGYWVCPPHWEARQPQDFVRSVADVQTPPWTQPPSDAYAAFCAPNDQTAIPHRAIPGCFMPNYTSPFYDATAPYPD